MALWNYALKPKKKKVKAKKIKRKAIPISKQKSEWKNKFITLPLKNGRPYKTGDKPPYTYKKYNYKVKLSKKNSKGAWTYDYVVLQKEPPSDHIREMIADWSTFAVITPKTRYFYQGKK